jgi:hypothetical protein
VRPRATCSARCNIKALTGNSRNFVRPIVLGCRRQIPRISQNVGHKVSRHVPVGDGLDSLCESGMGHQQFRESVVCLRQFSEFVETR